MSARHGAALALALLAPAGAALAQNAPTPASTSAPPGATWPASSGATGESSAAYWRIMPASSNCFKRRKQGDGDKATRSDSSTLVRRPFSCNTCKIFKSVLSSVICAMAISL